MIKLLKNVWYIIQEAYIMVVKEVPWQLRYVPDEHKTKEICIKAVEEDPWGSNGLVVKALVSQSRGPVFKTTRWLQGRLSLSSFRGR